MKQSEYINTTNLTKLRCASTILGEVLPWGKVVTDERLHTITALILEMTDELEAARRSNPLTDD